MIQSDLTIPEYDVPISITQSLPVTHKHHWGHKQGRLWDGGAGTGSSYNQPQ